MTTQDATPDSILLSPAFKIFVIGLIILILLIPLLMVSGLVYERESRAAQVKREVAQQWGSSQAISGPFLVVPYVARVETRDGDKTVDKMIERRALFLPEDLDLKAKAASQLLHRSIFDVNVYTTDLMIEGRFQAPGIAEVDANAVSVRWRDAILALGFSDLSGLKESAFLEIAGADKLSFLPSIGLPGNQPNGIHVKLGTSAAVAPAADTPIQPFQFRIGLTFTGSTSLLFSPAARETRASMQSDWPHPSFTGAFLPAERSVRPDGFSASWKVPHLARSVPNSWNISDAGIERLLPYQFGVDFYAPVDFYDLVSRSVKYAILFLTLAFGGVFMLELFSGKRVHPVQYLFTGMAMVFFYVLLLSFAEHIGFSYAYFAASVATGGMLSLYVGKALASLRSGLIMLGLFLAIYGLLFLVLRMEDHALLAGALIGFAALTAVMFSTLDVDWTSARKTAERVLRQVKPSEDNA
jgi:inner membrane protein